MQPNTDTDTDSTATDHGRRLRAVVDRCEGEPATDGARAAAERDARSQPRSDETGGAEPETGTTSGLSTVSDRCSACGAGIGPREYRISRVVEQGPDAPTLEIHYCSEACLSADAPDPEPESRSESTSDRSNSPQDWSYCR